MNNIPKKLEDIDLFKKLSPEIAGRIKGIWEIAEPLLRHAQGTHPQYTSHGPDHSLMLLKIIDSAMSPLDIKLTDDELYILIVSTLLHDIGMVGKAGADDQYSSKVRHSHHIRTKKYIKDNYKSLSLDKAYKSPVADVASAHRKLNIEKHLEERPLGVGKPKPRLKLCASLLRLADECHITEDRVPEDYQILDLPKESIEHFLLHFNTRGLYFGPKKGIIEFTIEITNEHFDEFVQKAKIKIQEELDGLGAIFNNYGIGYKKIIFNEDREELIKRKVVRTLLKDGETNKEELINKVSQKGEKSDKIEDFLTINKDDEIFTYDDSCDNENYGLCPTLDNLCKLAEAFLEKTDKNDAYIFTKSGFVEKTLNKDVLDQLLLKSINVSDPRDVIYKIFTVSPRALAYLVQNKNSLPQKTGITGSDLWDTLKALLKKDFMSHPELLLEPGLLNESFPKEKYPVEWEQLKLLQIVEYHRVFDFERLFTRWCLPDEYLQKHLKENQGTITPSNINFGFKFTNDYQKNPLNWMIAGQRMKLPCRIEEGEGLEVEFSTNVPEIKNEFKNCSMLEIKPKKGINISSLRFVHARIYRKSGKYYIELVDMSSKEINYNKFPIVFELYIENVDNKKLSIKFKVVNIKLNWERLNCEQLDYLINISKKPKQINIVSNNATSTRFSSKNFSFSYEGMRKEFQQCISRLSKLQRFTGRSIPVPTSLDPKIEDFLLKENFKSKNEAARYYNKLKRKITKNTLTSFSFEFVNDNYANSLHHVRIEDFNIRNRLKLEMQKPSVDKMVKDSIKDPTKEISWDTNLLSKSREMILEQTVDVNQAMSFLKEIIAKTPEDYKSWGKYIIQPIKDRFWYDEIPFLIQLKQVTPLDQWRQEAAYFNQIIVDNNRHYLAAQEALQLSTGNYDSLIGAGWASFKCSRIKEAIELTKNVVNQDDEDHVRQFVASINLGLFYHWNNSSDNEIEKGRLHYDSALSIVEKLITPHREGMIDEAINDIETYSDSLSPEIFMYLEKFRDLAG